MNKHLIVESVVALKKSQLDELVKHVGADSVENRVLPSLLGGMRLRLAGKVIDLSLKNKISQLVDTL